VSRTAVYGAFVAGTLATFLGWIGAFVQGDAINPRTSVSLIIIFAIALALLTIPAIHLWRAKGKAGYVTLFFIGILSISCLYAIVGEFML
jgi:hypothetical protein